MPIERTAAERNTVLQEQRKKQTAALLARRVPEWPAVLVTWGRELRNVLQSGQVVSEVGFVMSLENVSKSCSISRKEAAAVLRACLTAQEHGVGLHHVIDVLGINETCIRIVDVAVQLGGEFWKENCSEEV